MSNKGLRVTIPEEEFLEKKIPDQLTIIFRVCNNIDKRLSLLEGKSVWNKVYSTAGGIAGGFIAIVLKIKLWD